MRKTLRLKKQNIRLQEKPHDSLVVLSGRFFDELIYMNTVIINPTNVDLSGHKLDDNKLY